MVALDVLEFAGYPAAWVGDGDDRVIAERAVLSFAHLQLVVASLVIKWQRSTFERLPVLVGPVSSLAESFAPGTMTLRQVFPGEIHRVLTLAELARQRYMVMPLMTASVYLAAYQPVSRWYSLDLLVLRRAVFVVEAVLVAILLLVLVAIVVSRMSDERLVLVTCRWYQWSHGLRRVSDTMEIVPASVGRLHQYQQQRRDSEVPSELGLAVQHREDEDCRTLDLLISVRSAVNAEHPLAESELGLSRILRWRRHLAE